ncbi:gliding motility lipoprotein GldD [soil metagenome]
MKNRRTNRWILLQLAVVLLLLSGCDDPIYTPKPKGYFRIELPGKAYQTYSSECPYSFEYPVYAKVERHNTFFGEDFSDSCWLDIRIPTLTGDIHLSYKNINETNTLEKLVEDAHQMAYKHTVKADYIDESLIRTPTGVGGILYELGGNSASNIQFYVTDSTKHFLRGSLYFGATPNQDSLAPVIQFVRADMLHLIETLEWK